MIKVVIGSETYAVANQWSELSNPIEIFEVMSSGGNFISRRLGLLHLILPASKAIRDHDVIYDLLRLTDWIQRDQIIEPIIPTFEWQGNQYDFPKSIGLNMTANQFAQAEAAAVSVITAPAKLDELVACVVLPSGDTFDSAKKEQHMQLVKRWPRWVKYYAYRFFVDIRAELHRRYEPAFDFKVGTGGDEENQPHSFGWAGTFFGIAEVGVFGNFSEVINTNIHTMLYYLAWQKSRDEAAKNEREKQRRQWQ